MTATAAPAKQTVLVPRIEDDELDRDHDWPGFVPAEQPVIAAINDHHNSRGIEEIIGFLTADAVRKVLIDYEHPRGGALLPYDDYRIGLLIRAIRAFASELNVPGRNGEGHACDVEPLTDLAARLERALTITIDDLAAHADGIMLRRVPLKTALAAARRTSSARKAAAR